ncbi:hypothetical protein Droror1_Dr00020674 [Drosera rotundifolia]
MAASVSDLQMKAKEAFIDDRFVLSVELNTQAIDLNPNNAELFADRAQANIKLANFTGITNREALDSCEVVVDANKAIQLDPSATKAYLRKGTACIELKEYQTAKVALETGSSLAPGDSRFTKLIEECDQRIAEENSTAVVQKASTAPAVSSPQASNSTTVPSATPAKQKIRHDFYQKSEEVVVTIFAKGIPAKNVSIDYGEQIMSATIDLPGQEPYMLQNRLFGKIVPSKCTYEVLSTKIEIRLAKAEPIHWTSLEFVKENIATQRINVSSGAHKPVYPSSKPAGADWDKLEAQVKQEEKNEKLDGDAPLNKFFRDIYSDADEDTRRAMCKSFVESNGTVLSTNWKEVGAKKVEGSPPDY